MTTRWLARSYAIAHEDDPETELMDTGPSQKPDVDDPDCFVEDAEPATLVRPVKAKHGGLRQSKNKCKPVQSSTKVKVNDDFTR